MKLFLRFLVVIDLVLVSALMLTVVTPTEFAVSRAKMDYLRQYGTFSQDEAGDARWNRLQAEVETAGKITTYGFVALLVSVNVGIVILMCRLRASCRTEATGD